MSRQPGSRSGAGTGQQIKTELKTKQRKARRQPMPKLLVSILILFAVAVIGGGIYIAVWDVPPPARTVEKVLPDDMLGK